MNLLQQLRAAATVAAVVYSLPGQVQAADSVYYLDIPAENMRSALRAYSEATGRQIALFTGGAGVNSSEVKGDFTALDALQRLLQGTGFSYSAADDGSVVIEALPADTTNVTAPVVVSATPGELASAGIGPNGSSDVTATEGTGSLTAQVATIGSKVPLKLSEIDQSVSVITAKQIEDMNLESLDEVMQQTPGITVATGINNTNNLAPAYFSRGFQIQNFQIDGGAPLTTGNSNIVTTWMPIYDMSMFDHVEILRGASGLYGGVGDPGGMLSLERKRPLDHEQLVVDGEVGSWQKGRASVDYSTPLDAQDRFGIRAVLTWDSQHFFYDTAKKRNEMAYVNFEAKLTPSTTLNLGTSFNNQTATPWAVGLPRYADGASLGLPRSACLCTSWSTQTNNTNEYFVQLHQKIGEHWSVHAHLDENYQNGSYNEAGLEANYSGLAADGSGAFVAGAYGPLHTRQQSADVNVLGEFTLFGHTHQLTLGTSYQSVDGQATGSSGGAYYSSGPFNLFAWNPGAFTAADATASELPNTADILKYDQYQRAAYATLRLNPLDHLHITVGDRVNEYDTAQAVLYTYSPTPQLTEFRERHTAPPFVGLSYDVTGTTSVYASYASIYDSNAAVVTKELTPIDPTTGTNSELGVKRSDFGGALNSSLALYYIAQKNFPDIDESVYVNYPQNYPTNVPPGVICCDLNDENNRRISKGVDAEISGALTPRWQLTASYTYNDNKILQGLTDEGALSSFAPRHLFKSWSTYRLPGDAWWRNITLGAGVGAQSASYIAGALYDTTPSIPVHFSQSGYAVVDTMARWDINRHALVQLNINNLFDRNYYQTIGSLQGGNWYGAPRNIMLSAKWRQ